MLFPNRQCKRNTGERGIFADQGGKDSLLSVELSLEQSIGACFFAIELLVAEFVRIISFRESPVNRSARLTDG